jgi:hypothetical protein
VERTKKRRNEEEREQRALDNLWKQTAQLNLSAIIHWHGDDLDPKISCHSIDTHYFTHP